MKRYCISNVYERYLNIFKLFEPEDGTVISITIVGQSELGSNSNKEVLHTPQISKPEASTSNVL